MDEYKIAKAIKHTYTVVMLYVRYKMTSDQLTNFFVLFFYYSVECQHTQLNCKI